MNKFSTFIVLALLLVGASATRSWEYKGSQRSGFLDSQPVATGLCDTVKQESGYFRINDTDVSKDKHYFYWFFEARNNPETAPVAIWLTGGPGCSSMLALLAENGPCKVTDGTTTESNPDSWNENINIMWVDQPAGVGFSYGNEDDHDEAGVAEDMFHFLQEWFAAHEQFQNNKFFAFGESYGGHYVPAVSYRVYMGNKNHEGLKINLAGLAVGNGLTNPYVQYQYYGKMAYGGNSHKIKVVSQSGYDQMQAAVQPCIEKIATCQNDTSACAGAQSYCNNNILAAYEETGQNVYDIRKPCGPNPLCYDFSKETTFLNDAGIKSQLHVDPSVSKWQSCNMAVNMKFSQDWMKDFSHVVPPMLHDGVRVLIYAGDVDFICNYLGNQAWTKELEWDGHDEFNKVQVANWNVNGKAAGLARSAQDFTFLQVFDAGHMVPLDQPENALDMIDRFVNNKGFSN
jgi:cathepsin A (carboxypeptidase C)